MTKNSSTDAKLPLALAATDNTKASRRIPLDRIALAAENRKYAGDDDSRVLSLSQSIAANGQLHPVLVRPRDEGGGYEMVCGEGRYRACRRLGLADVRAEIREMTSLEARAMRLVENIDRSPLTYLEQAQAVHDLLVLHDDNAAEVGRRIGLSESAVRLRARLNDLSDAWRQRLSEPESDYAHIGRNITWMEQIAILPPARQDEMLDDNALLYTRNKRQLDAAIGQYMCSLDPAAKPWTREFERTHYAGSSGIPGKARCEACSCRTDRIGILPGLEPDGKLAAACAATPHCLNAECYHGKAVAFRKYLLKKYREFCEVVLIWDGYPLPHDSQCWKTDYPGETVLSRGEFQHMLPPDQEAPPGYAPVKAIVIGGHGAAERDAIDVYIPIPAQEKSSVVHVDSPVAGQDAINGEMDDDAPAAPALPSFTPPQRRQLMDRLRDLPPPMNPFTLLRALLFTGTPPLWASPAAARLVPDMDMDAEGIDAATIMANLEPGKVMELGWDMAREVLDDGGEASQMSVVLDLYGNAPIAPKE